MNMMNSTDHDREQGTEADQQGHGRKINCFDLGKTNSVFFVVFTVLLEKT